LGTEAGGEIQRADVAPLHRVSVCILGVAVSNPGLAEMKIELRNLEGVGL
jgi:hypothetical protein